MEDPEGDDVVLGIAHHEARRLDGKRFPPILQEHGMDRWVPSPNDVIGAADALVELDVQTAGDAGDGATAKVERQPKIDAGSPWRKAPVTSATMSSSFKSDAKEHTTCDI